MGLGRKGERAEGSVLSGLVVQSVIVSTVLIKSSSCPDFHRKASIPLNMTPGHLFPGSPHLGPGKHLCPINTFKVAAPLFSLLAPATTRAFTLGFVMGEKETEHAEHLAQCVARGVCYYP